MEGDADACTDSYPMAAQLYRIGQLLQHSLGEPGGVFRSIERRPHNDEFVPAESRNEVTLPHQRLQPPRNHDKQLISDTMAEGIVDALETIEIDHHERGKRLRGG